MEGGSHHVWDKSGVAKAIPDLNRSGHSFFQADPVTSPPLSVDKKESREVGHAIRQEANLVLRSLCPKRRACCS